MDPAHGVSHRPPRLGRGGYAGKLVDYAATMLGITVKIVTKLAGQIGFVALRRRWCVERTFSWINRCRRAVRDYERLPAHHAAMVYWAMIIVVGRRLTRHHSAVLGHRATCPRSLNTDICRALTGWASSTSRGAGRTRSIRAAATQSITLQR
jgi:hypothetical protein